MPNLCAYPPCKCLIEGDEMFCSDVCALLGARVVNKIRATTAVPLKDDEDVVPRCGCGHAGCGDTLVSGTVS